VAGTAAVRGRLHAVVEPVVAIAGYDLEDVTVTPAGRRRVVRVVVDRDGGVALDDVADVARAVSQALDAADALGPTPYVLEVTSPGVDRPLREPRHWRRAVGRLVAVTTPDGRVTGRVLAADHDGVELEAGSASRHWPYADLGPGAVQVEFGRENDEDGESG
jgi:ribosome maturation factor RimP